MEATNSNDLQNHKKKKETNLDCLEFWEEMTPDLVLDVDVSSTPEQHLDTFILGVHAGMMKGSQVVTILMIYHCSYLKFDQMCHQYYQ